MYRPLATIHIPATAQATLQENGFVYCEDIMSHKGINSEAQNILHQWNLHGNESWRKLTSPPCTSNALDVWQEEYSNPGIVTWSRDVDLMLGGGVPLQAITELCGAPGCGKTQMCLQLCVDVQIPDCLGGIDGEAIFIDTASNFSPHRLRDMADACCKHCQTLIESQTGQEPRELKKFESNKILNGIHVISIHGSTQLLAAVKLLPAVLKQHPKVRLIVVDSIAFPFNCGDTSTTIERTSYLYRILADLQRIAIEEKLAVVVTNQLTTRLIKTVDTKSELSPALGESFGHRVNLRVLLGRSSSNSIAAILLKGNNQTSSTAKFQIVKDGIRDCA